ncbi:response regulator [Trinickia sp. LjRoot230]|uniref:response regulator n=1 Tax=Trinickia sp. LjRoot230 TaxID=3342288 RepID=UPI003ED0A4A7
MSPLKDDPSILIAAETEASARRVARLVEDEFRCVRISTRTECIVSDFEAFRPVVVVLAFDRFDAATRYCDRLYGASRLIHAIPHRTIVLCAADELRRVYDSCKRGVFDDYVLFWPTTNDGPRLAMAVHHALHRLSKSSPDAVSAGQLAAHARHIASLEPTLAELARRFACEVDRTGAVAATAQHEAGDACARPFRRLGESVDALCHAAQALAVALGPQLRAARAMGELAQRVRPAVLVVDDDAFQRSLLARLLDGTKVDLSCATSGAQAFGAIWNRRPDLVLMDIDLPDVTGMELTRRLKSVRPLAHIPVIMVTGHSERTVVMESLRAGAADFMVKPFRRATLLQKLEAFLPGAIL